MRIKSSMEQAVYTLLLLARLPGHTSLTAEAISERMGTSPSYFKKGMRQLVQAGLVRSSTGIRGGFSLSRPPSAITLLDIFLAVEGHGSLYQDGGVHDRVLHSDSSTRCILSTVMYRAESAWKQELAKETLSSMLEELQHKYPSDCLKTMDEWIHLQIERVE
ncbi:transcriptional regulator, BadM/Rrf2 family [Marininema mesophilum]|uniref:Transcriptional regulator, BadM/Rrf2 family n=1 Tax=Marininema mesophilum TaxID=1048340 RepID=A0A1H2V6M4_9BACL|nr:Rrf2 family transcriptional regulator [Marininema mesophilum]SDW63910.1 transcriptional regulator, BadM/Rrf2 family [Marininema mesophilum]